MINFKAFATRALRWADTIERVHSEVASMEPEDAFPTPELDDEFHLVAIALGHLERYVRRLDNNVNPDLQGAIDMLLQEWESPISRLIDQDASGGATAALPLEEPISIKLRELRNALEHKDEYVAGGGRFPHLATSMWKDLNYSGDGHIFGTGDIHFYYVLGTAYRVRK